ncbi:MAG: type III restriction endonuclease subunit R, partial [Dissulfuribacterales bacterium]
MTHLYTIVPLRAANARILIEQSIGRGLRLPYGGRTGVMAVDRLNIVAHDRFQEIIDEANHPDSAIRLQTVVIDPDELAEKTATVVSQPQLASSLGLKSAGVTGGTIVAGDGRPCLFAGEEEQRTAQAVWEEIRKYEGRPQTVPSVSYLKRPEIQTAIVKAMEERQPPQRGLEGFTEKPDIAAVVAKTVELTIEHTIDIPRILVVPQGEVKSGYKPFILKLDSLRYPPVSEDLWVQYLRTGDSMAVTPARGQSEEPVVENYIVRCLMDFSDISYDDHADLLYDLAGQAIRHFGGYLKPEEVIDVVRCHQHDIARFIHAQMQEHYWEDASAGYELKVSKGFTELKPSAYTCAVKEPPLDFRVSPLDKSNMAKYLFGGFRKCLYPVQKFDSESERILAVILDRDAL